MGAQIPVWAGLVMLAAGLVGGTTAGVFVMAALVANSRRPPGR